MRVLKRSGHYQEVSFDKIKDRIQSLVNKEPRLESINVGVLTQKVIFGLVDGIKTSNLDVYSAECAAELAVKHLDYDVLAGRILVSNLQKQTAASLYEVSLALTNNINPQTGKRSSLLSERYFALVEKHRKELEEMIDYERDYKYGFLAFCTLTRQSYLLKSNGVILERPQHWHMRVALNMHGDDLVSVKRTYDSLSLLEYCHATPTGLNSGTSNPQLSSCFLLPPVGDSIEGIYDALKDCAIISKTAGGIGFPITNVRGEGAYIQGSNGTSPGIVPMLRVFNDTAVYVDQGGGKRKGAFAVYIEPWHWDILSFLNLKKTMGVPESRQAKDLFYGLWIPDLFMHRAHKNEIWTLFSPDSCPDLVDLWGADFEERYVEYEKMSDIPKKQINAMNLLKEICEAQINTGTPYMMYKDACNGKSNQKNLGTIKSSNLCTEIVEYTQRDEIAVCNLASISLPSCVVKDRVTDQTVFDHDKLKRLAYDLTLNLNRVIDVTRYPLESTKKSNMRHRPIGIGVQGLAYVFMLLRIPFEGSKAKQLNKEIFETLYYGALEASIDLAEKDGHYETFPKSPASEGVLSFELWSCQYSAYVKNKPVRLSGRWDFEKLRERLSKHGMRNSLLIAPMPTVSTSQIMGNSECFEPLSSNIFSKRILSGEYLYINPILFKHLQELGIWTEELGNTLIRHGGSVTNIEEIPREVRQLYKTVWEMDYMNITKMMLDRAAFIDQSQSFSVYIKNADVKALVKHHFFTWSNGAKTGMYYNRMQPASLAIKFSVESIGSTETKPKKPKDVVKKVGDACNLEEGCVSCGS